MRGFQGAATHCDKAEPLFRLCSHGVASGLGIGLHSSREPGLKPGAGDGGRISVLLSLAWDRELGLALTKLL